MKHTYSINGMTCNNCADKVKSALLDLNEILNAEISLIPPKAVITMNEHIPLAILNKALAKSGNYTLSENEFNHISENKIAVQHLSNKQIISDVKYSEEKQSFFKTYKPVLLVFIYLFITVTLSIILSQSFDIMALMQLFMGGFFLVFSFFKMLDLKGFAYSYMSYDIIAKKWLPWGYIYPFVELLLGLSFLFHVMINEIIIVTLIVMSLSSIGVIKSVISGKKIPCACLGTVFNLPVSNITLIEDLLMVIMSAIMLII